MAGRGLPKLLRTSVPHFGQKIQRQSFVRNPIFFLVSLLVLSGHGCTAWLLPRASPTASTYALPRESYAISCAPVPRVHACPRGPPECEATLPATISCREARGAVQCCCTRLTTVCIPWDMFFLFHNSRPGWEREEPIQFGIPSAASLI